MVGVQWVTVPADVLAYTGCVPSAVQQCCFIWSLFMCQWSLITFLWPDGVDLKVLHKFYGWHYSPQKCCFPEAINWIMQGYGRGFLLDCVCYDRGWVFKADSRFAPRQWETSLQSNTVSHWVGANLESALILGYKTIKNVQWGAVIAQSNIIYCLHHCSDWSRT